MKITIFSIAISLIILACGGAEMNNGDGNASNDTPKAKQVAKKVDGEKIYKNYCVTCQGLYGDMGASGAKNLQESTFSLEERIEIITNGKNTMTPFKDLLNEEKIKAVAEYTFKLKDK